MARRPLSRGQIADGVEAAARAPVPALAGGDINRARALWALAHGLVDLELAGRFPEGADIDAAWSAALDVFTPTTAQPSQCLPPSPAGL
jgi:hypothetical protein